MAVLNGVVVREGAQHPPFRIERIESRGAVLSGPTGMVTVPLLIPSVGSPRETRATAAVKRPDGGTPLRPVKGTP